MSLQRKFELLRPRLDEASLRLCAAADTLVLGRGGPSLVAKASGLSRTTIYDFADKELGKIVPYGVYDLTHNQGWVSVGINHENYRIYPNYNQ